MSIRAVMQRQIITESTKKGTAIRTVPDMLFADEKADVFAREEQTANDFAADQELLDLFIRENIRFISLYFYTMV